MDGNQRTISQISDSIRELTFIGGVPIRDRVAPMVDKGRRINRLGREVAREGVALLRDLVHERPIVVFGVFGATALLLARFASARTLGRAAAIGVQVANLTADNVPNR
jgi:hypothetical protein